MEPEGPDQEMLELIEQADGVIEEIQTSFDTPQLDTPQQNDTGNQDGTQVVTTNSNQSVM